jgi:hypothetical protein
MKTLRAREASWTSGGGLNIFLQPNNLFRGVPMDLEGVCRTPKSELCVCVFLKKVQGFASGFGFSFQTDKTNKSEKQ